jgi:hypothetical protein
MFMLHRVVHLQYSIGHVSFQIVERDKFIYLLLFRRFILDLGRVSLIGKFELTLRHLYVGVTWEPSRLTFFLLSH